MSAARQLTSITDSDNSQLNDLMRLAFVVTMEPGFRIDDDELLNTLVVDVLLKRM